MREPPRTETIAASDAHREWDALLHQVAAGEKRWLIERHGALIATLISSADLDRLARLEAAQREGFAAIRRIGEAFADVPPDELEAEAVKVVRQIRRD